MIDDAAASAVETWFGAAFARLHPQLQALHREGGRLTGPVTFEVGRGPGGLLGRALLRRLGIDPASGPHSLTVDIRHVDGALRWARRFDDGPEATTWFRPHGRWPSGDWTERAGPLELTLDVDIAEGGWRWRPRRYRLFGWPLPSRLCPRIAAGKRIVEAHYRFDVSIDLPLIGRVLAWGGALRMAS